MSEPDWLATNRNNWDERVGVHLGPRGYDLTRLRQGRGELDPIVEAELPSVSGKRVLHLQCHFGADTLRLAQRGAEVVGLDFSAPAIAAAEDLAAELGLTASARFVQANVYDAPDAVPEPGAFDLVFVTWGALPWLPDIRRWAGIVVHFLKPNGAVYLAEGHPAALVLDDDVPHANGDPRFLLPYFHTEALVLDNPSDYADPTACLSNSTTYEWVHPVSDVVTALIAAGVRLEWLHEHNAVVWQMFKCLEEGPDRLFRWRNKPWLPLSYSLLATRPAP